MRYTLILITLLLSLISVYGQSDKDYEKMEGYLSKEKFYSCYKYASKHSGDNGGYDLFRIAALGHLSAHKKIRKERIKVYVLCTDVFTKIKTTELPSDLPHLHKELGGLLAQVSKGLKLALKKRNKEKCYAIISSLARNTNDPKNPCFSGGRYLPLKTFYKGYVKAKDEKDYTSQQFYLNLLERFVKETCAYSIFTFEGDRKTGYAQLQGSLFKQLEDAITSKDFAMQKYYSNLLVKYFDNSKPALFNKHVVYIYQNVRSSQNAIRQNPKLLGSETNLDGYKKKHNLEGWEEITLKWSNNSSDYAYISDFDKEVIFLTNLVRMEPQKFIISIVEPYYETELIRKNKYSSSLISDLKKQENLVPLIATPQLTKCANYTANAMGRDGRTGHVTAAGETMSQRMKKFKAEGGLRAENCSYSKETPLAVVMQLLIDNGVPSLGHRKNILLKEAGNIGVGTAPHKSYGTNTVMNFTN